jgi:hypothetical protein
VDLTVFRLSLPGVGVAPEDHERERRSLLPVAGMLHTLGGGEQDRALVLPWPPAGNYASEARVHIPQGL